MLIIVVLKEDVKELKTIKRAMRSRDFEEFPNGFRLMVRERERGWLR